MLQEKFHEIVVLIFTNVITKMKSVYFECCDFCGNCRFLLNSTGIFEGENKRALSLAECERRKAGFSIRSGVPWTV